MDFKDPPISKVLCKYFSGLLNFLLEGKEIGDSVDRSAAFRWMDVATYNSI